MNRPTIHFKQIIWVITITLAALASGCGGGGSGSGSASGILGVSLTDAPACGFDAVNVTVNKVRVHQSSTAADADAGWAEITLSPERKIDLLGLSNGVREDLGQTPLAAGHYSQLRLVLNPNTGQGTANSVVLSGTTTEIPLNTPSAVQSGIKLINEFDVAAGQRVDLMLDFDACKSIVTRGNGSYALKPVVRVIPFALNGISGYVDTALISSNTRVSAQQSGAIIRSTALNPQTGEFLLAYLPVGNYDIVITADNHATAVITAVPVTSSTSITGISTINSRITLPPSLTHTISGTVALNPPSQTEAAYVTAKQTLGAPSTTITVKSQAADLLSSAYTLTLPTASPELGSYSPQGVVLVAQPAIAGKYSAEASATGYTTPPPVSLDISAGNVIQNFTLAP